MNNISNCKKIENGLSLYQLGHIKIAFGAVGVIGSLNSPNNPTIFQLNDFERIFSCTLVSVHPNNYERYKINISKNTIKAFYNGSSEGHSSHICIIGI